ncbi:DUF2218 domain-containing protein [Novosphingobium olei]|uniref:DUF2218 domain-containing protein n=1 Tax=Novosphingobium olei TaxID=2728851 RepID=A0A7Y0BNW0_9SPHN|nr:DUF2218 domain-containing protein [Novosphingobium olei]NML93941.1 DUF2218 domain-containing protein [Novosphingobium olei]BEV01124.1 DUF2218 domain-containing protein [Novosphingobium olei]
MTDTTSTFASTARVPTASGSRYLQQLCKHWAHNLAVEFDAQHGKVTFPRDARGASWAGDAVVTFDAEPDVLVCRIEASEPGQRDGLKGAVARHVDRFAFREAPLPFEWVDA